MLNRAGQILQMLTEEASEFVALRQDIHRHPELAYDEHRTSKLVAEKLQAWGYDVERGLGGTGVVGRLKRGSGSKTVGIRADMDALPIEETTGLPYASCHHGVMHACGHDGHTAMLLGAAKVLARDGRFSGTLNLIFQPAEEGGGGALKMMDDGLFEKYPCDAVYAMHNAPLHPAGKLMFREGAAMASSDYVAITVHGVGGHGAFPHSAQDPIVAAASLIMALQTIVSRNIDPQSTAVITVGAIHAGKANNVIPPSCKLELSVRALDREVRNKLEARITEVAKAQAQSFGCTAEVDYKRGYSVLVNTPAETEIAREVGAALLGEEGIERQTGAVTGSEDFAFMLERKPGCYLFIGNGAGAGSCMVHNPGYDFNDSNVPVGAAYWVCLAEKVLSD